MRRPLLLFVLTTAAVIAPQAIAQSSTYLDTTCAPCTDFYQYANGAWLKTAVIPAAWPRTGVGREVDQRNKLILREILDSAAKNARTQPDPTLKKLGAFYATCMDSARSDRAGFSPLAPTLALIGKIQTPADLQAAFAMLLARGIAAPFYLVPEADPRASRQTIGQLYQGGLGLPDRDYYLKTDPASDSLRKKYVAHIARVLALNGLPDAAARDAAARIMKLETTLAQASMPLVEQRDPHAVYHRIRVDSLQRLAPNINWTALFRSAGATALTASGNLVDVSQPAFLVALNRAVRHTPLPDWRLYLRWQMLAAYAPTLSTPFVKEDFAFNSIVNGTKEIDPRWRRCGTAADAAMGEALGKAFVAREFSPATKARVLEMVHNIEFTLGARIDALTWMSPATKRLARIKLDSIVQKIGYPDKWRDYSTLTISPDSAFAVNWIAANIFETQRNFAKIGKPVDRTEWGMTPPTVDAYYNATSNDINFPAGILTPPFFDPSADDAANYGAIGAVIGHEITHGFDDQGRQFDASGNLRDWWTAADAKSYTTLAERTVAQYDGYVAVDTLHVNGRLTLGENIADLGGLTIAYYAYQHSLAGKTAPAVVDGLTGDQRFFVAYGQVWRQKARDEATRLRVLTDPHSPAVWRVNGVVVNMPEFAKAFGCKTGDRMVLPEDARAQIW